MKKILSLIAVVCLLLTFAGCGGETPSTPSGSNAPTPATDGFTFTYNGTEIVMKAPAEPIVAALGEAKSYTEEASCAFTGLDKTYYYGSFYLETFPQDGKDYVFGLWFADDSVATKEGIYIGATQAQVEAAYGADNFNGANGYELTKGETKLTIILQDGVVSSIQYSIVI